MIRLLFASLLWMGPLSAHAGIEMISPRDRQTLNAFFDYLLHYTGFGFTLCGEKPVALETFYALSKLTWKQRLLVILFHYRGYTTVWNGWQTWQKYQHLFPSQKYVLRFVPEYDTLILINRKAVKQVIHENADMFQGSIDEILADIYFAKRREYLIRDEEALLGILLGYGRNNALAFADDKRRRTLGFFSLPEETEGADLFINPGFRIIDDGSNWEENQRIRELFLQARENLIRTLQTEKPLEAFIRIFTERVSTKCDQDALLLNSSGSA